MKPDISDYVEEITMTLPSGFGHDDTFLNPKPHEWWVVCRGNSVFANLIFPVQPDFKKFLAEELEALGKTKMNLKWVTYKELDINKFLYVNYLERGDFIELSFWKNKYIRGIIEEISSDGFFVILQIEIGLTTYEGEQATKKLFYGYTLLEIPIIAGGDREIYFSAGKVKESRRDLSNVTKRDLRDTVKEIDNVNHDLLSEQEYTEFIRMLQYFNGLREDRLTSVRCLVPKDSQRELKALPLSIQERIKNIFKRNK